MKPMEPASVFKIPLFDLDIGEEEIRAVNQVLRSKWLTMGETTQRFEQAFAKFLGVPYCFAVSSGTAALHLAVKALGIGPGDEVVCPSLTFVATSNAILYSGATPVFADIVGKDDLNISPESIESRVTRRTRAVIVMHYGGYPCQMDKILDIARRYDLKIIEDAAHAPGAEFIWRDTRGKIIKRQKAGTIGDIGCFSFFSNKNLSTGEGGMVATGDPKIAEKIKILRSHGMTTLTLDRYRGHSYSYDVVDLGYNYRIDEVRSAIGMVQLKKLEEKNKLRKALDGYYRKELDAVPGVGIPFANFGSISAHYIFPVLLSRGSDRARFMESLKKKGIQTSIHYPPIHNFLYYRGLRKKRAQSLALTEYAGSHEVTLPFYPSLTKEKVRYISDCIRDLVRGRTLRQ